MSALGLPNDCSWCPKNSIHGHSKFARIADVIKHERTTLVLRQHERTTLVLRQFKSTGVDAGKQCLLSVELYSISIKTHQLESSEF